MSAAAGTLAGAGATGDVNGRLCLLGSLGWQSAFNTPLAAIL
jgi:hypothetical protein